MAGRPFTEGADQRRHPGGRPPSARTLRALIRRTLARDAQALVEQVRALSLSGDPAALTAAALLLVAAVEPSRAEPAAEVEHG